MITIKIRIFFYLRVQVLVQ